MTVTIPVSRRDGKKRRRYHVHVIIVVHDCYLIQLITLRNGISEQNENGDAEKGEHFRVDSG